MARKFLEQVQPIDELLVEGEPDEFEFANLNFQEYLAATQIAQQRQDKLTELQANLAPSVYCCPWQNDHI